MANAEYEMALNIAWNINQSLEESYNMTKKSGTSSSKDPSVNQEKVDFSEAGGKADSKKDISWDETVKTLKTTTDALKKVHATAGELASTKNSVLEFAGPFTELGDWMIENPDVIAGTLSGIGTVIDTLKLAQSVSGLASSLDVLFKAMMSSKVSAVLGVAVLAGGAIIGVVEQIKKAEEEMKKKDLAKRFGNVTLSLKDLHEVANAIIGEDTIIKLNQSLEEMGKVNEAVGELTKNSDITDKLMWKIHMGLELDEEDQSLFRDTLDQTIKGSIELIEQAEYAAYVNVNTMFGTGDENGQQLIDGFHAMFNGINEEAAQINVKLEKAYEDKDYDEVQNLQNQLAELAKETSQAQFDAKMDRIRILYEDKELDKETLLSLSKEVDDHVAELREINDQIFDYNQGTLNQQWERSQSGKILKSDSAYLTEEMYNERKQGIGDEYRNYNTELDLIGFTFEADSIKNFYSEEFSNFLPLLADVTDKALLKAMDDVVQGDENIIDRITFDVEQSLDGMGLYAAGANIREMWDEIEPQFQALIELRNKLETENKEVPSYITEAIDNALELGVIARNSDAIWEFLGRSVTDNPEFENTLLMYEEAGCLLPERFSESMKRNIKPIKDSVDDIQKAVQSYLQQNMEVFEVNSMVKLNFRFSGVYSQPTESNDPPNTNTDSSSHTPLPVENSSSKSILDRTSQTLSSSGNTGNVTGQGGLSAMGVNNRNESHIVYSPNVYVQAGGEGAVNVALEDTFAQFDRLYKQRDKDNKRLNYGECMHEELCDNKWSNMGSNCV